MATPIFDQLLHDEAYPYVYVLHVHGLPWLFCETLPKRATATTPIGLPAGFVAAVGALVLDSGVALSGELDRETGVARGDAITFTLAYEPLEAAGLLGQIFRRPSKRSRLTAAISHTATTWTVDDTTGWVGGDLGFIGRECVRVGQVASGTSLETMTRGIVGLADRYTPTTATSFAELTDTPQIFRGRRCTLYRHLLTPEGRFMQSSWLEAGGLTRVEWEGYLDEQPRPTDIGMALRALPLPRLAAEEIGYEVGMRVVRPTPDFTSWANFPIVVGPGSSLTIRGRYTGMSAGTFEVTIGTYTAPQATTLGQWMRTLTLELDAALVGQPWYTSGAMVDRAVAGTSAVGNFRNSPPFISITSPYDPNYTIQSVSVIILPVPQLYWLRPGVFEGFAWIVGQSQLIHFDDKIRLVLSTPPGAWLVVEQTDGEGWQDLAIPASGAAVLEGETGNELLRWDQSQAAPYVNPRWVMLRIIERGAGGTLILDLNAIEEVELRFVAGSLGTVSEILLRLLMSSGTGNRGTYDTLGLGLGCGIEEAAIDVPTIRDDPDLGVMPIAAFASGRTSIEDLIGGWLALHGKCLAMRVVVDPTTFQDRSKLTIVSVLPIAYGPSTVSLERADVELSGVGTPEPIAAANEIRVSRDSIRSEVGPVIVQDLPSIQAAGPRTLELSCPGMSVTEAIQLAASRIAAGLGTTVAAFAVAPGVRLWPGDPCVVRVAHPATYDWGAGRRAPPAIAGVVMGESATPWDGRRQLIVMMAGVLAEGSYLAPDIKVDYADSKNMDFYGPSSGNLTIIAAISSQVRVRLYNPGYPAENDTFLVEISGEDTLTLVSGSFPAWVNDTTTRLTLADESTGDPDVEALHMFQSPSRRWSP